MKTNYHIANCHIALRTAALANGIKFNSWNVYGWRITTAYEPTTGRFGLSFCHTGKETFDRKYGQALAYNRLLTGRKYAGMTTTANWRNTAYLIGFVAHVNGDMLPSNLERKLTHILV